MTWLARFAGILGYFIAVHTVLAQPPALQTPPTATELSIDDAATKLASGKVLDAIELYQRILDTVGDELVPVTRPRGDLQALAFFTGSSILAGPNPRTHWMPARWVCHLHLSRMPAAALKQYRERIDVQAARRAAVALNSPDDRLSEAMLADFFCSTASESVILRLAERAFDQGAFARAESYWRYLAIPASETPSQDSRLHFPAPKADPAAIRARLILLQLYRQELDAARQELKAFRAAHPNATGLFAGKLGRYTDVLAEMALHPSLFRLQPLPEADSQWPSFAGGADRAGVVHGKVPHYWPDRPAWEVALPTVAPPRGKRGEELPFPTDHPRVTAFHPVVAHGYVYVADAMQVTAYHLRTGDAFPVFDLRRTHAIAGIDASVPVRKPLRYTLSIARDHLYVRLGTQRLAPAENVGEKQAEPRDNYSTVVCLGPLRDARPDTLAVRWTITPPNAEKDPTAIFEGTPLVEGAYLYALVWRMVGGEAVRSVVCLRHTDPGDKPTLMWQRDVGRAAINPTGEPETMHHLLTLAGNNVVCANHGGSVLALDRRTGVMAWAVQYPRKEANTTRSDEPAACLFDAGRVFVAPQDTHTLFCLDAVTGRPLWDRDGMEGVQMLGVARGRLICTLRGSVKGIRGLDIATGSDTGPKGWAHHDSGDLTSFGRGFVTPDLVVWPSKHGLHFLRPEDGSSARDPIPGMHGNLCCVEGCLIVTTGTTIRAHLAERTFLQQRRKDVEADPKDLQMKFRLAPAEADAGRWRDSAKHWKSLIADGGNLGTEARTRLEQLLIDASHADRVAGIFRFPPPEMADTTKELPFDYYTVFGLLADGPAMLDDAQLPQAIDAMQQAISATSLLVRDSDGRLVTLEQAVGLWIEQVIREKGRGCYARWDAEARKLPTQTLADKVRLLQRLPHSEAAKAILRDDLVIPQDVDPAEAMAFCRTAMRANQFLGLLIDEKKLRRDLEGWEQRLSVGKVPDGKLKAEPIHHSGWVALRAFQGDFAALDRRGNPIGCVGNTVVKLDVTQGKASELGTMPFDPEFAEAYAQSLIIAGHGGIARIPLQGGEPLWRVIPIALEILSRKRSPTRRSLDRPTPPPRLSGFRISGDRLFCFADERELLAIRLDSGLIDWSSFAGSPQSLRGADGVRFHPHTAVGSRQLMVQTTSGSLRLIDRESGRIAVERPTAVEPWPDSPTFVAGTDDVITWNANSEITRLQGGVRVVWRIPIPLSTNSSGKLPRLRIHGTRVLIGFPCNHGMELDCFDLNTGARLWNTGPIFLGRDVEDLHRMGIDNAAFYVATEGNVAAYDLTSGKQRWMHPIPGTEGVPWVIRTIHNGLLMHPPTAPRKQSTVDEWDRFWARGITLPRLAGTATRLYDGWMSRSFPILLIEPQTGKLMRRITTPAKGPSAEVTSWNKHWIVTIGEGCRVLAQE